MKARASTIGDLEVVFGGLSQRLSEEYKSSGLGTREIQDNLTMNLKEGRAHTLLDGDDVVAVIAWHEADDAAHTIFAAREAFFSAASVRFCKRHIRRIQALSGDVPIRHRSWIDRPEVARWFNVIGFIESGSNGKSTTFELPRP